MRILQLVKTSVGATWALRQMRELVKLGVEVHVAIPGDGPLVSQYKSAGVVVHPLQTDFPVRNLWTCGQVFSEFKALVADINPEVIHSHFVGTTLTMRLALGKKHPTPRIFQVPGPLHLEHPLFRWAELATAGKQDYWIGSCNWTGDRYRRSGVSNKRLFLSYYGVDLDEFKSHKTGKLRAELGVHPDTKLVGMVAYMYAPKRLLGQRRGLKGHEDLIDAVALCVKTEPNILCVFIGGAWNNAHAYEARLRAYGRKVLGERAVFLGTRSDVSELYADLNVAVHPSHSENAGGAVESLLLAVPTIATNVGGLPDIVRNHQTGWLVPACSPAQLADAILEAVRDPQGARQKSLKGQELVRELFDVRDNARQVLEIYRKVFAEAWEPSSEIALAQGPITT
jgi:glycosyltransferase involved in cell wall biosynthesis